VEEKNSRLAAGWVGPEQTQELVNKHENKREELVNKHEEENSHLSLPFLTLSQLVQSPSLASHHLRPFSPQDQVLAILPPCKVTHFQLNQRRRRRGDGFTFFHEHIAYWRIMYHQ